MSDCTDSQAQFILIDSEHALYDGDGKRLKIRPQSYEVFSVLYESANQVVSKENLFKQVWDSVTVTDDSISQCISEIRRNLGNEYRHLLKTIPKKGYVLSTTDFASGRKIIAKLAALPPKSATPQPEPTINKFSRKFPSNDLSKNSILIGGLLFAATALLTYHFFGSANQSTEIVRAIAVLPFKNLNGDITDDYLSNGTAEDLITDLSTLSGLRVIARNSTFAFKESNFENINTIAEQLGVQYIVSGSVRRNGSKIRINVEISDTENNTQLWAERFDGEINNLFDLQDKISQSVVKALALNLTFFEKKRLNKKPTESLEAYSLYQRGRSFTFSSQRDLGQEYLHKATEIDPSFASAYAALAVSHAISVSFGQSKDIENELDTAFRLATKAVSIDSHSAEAHVALAQTFLLRGKHQESIRSAQQAIDRNPSYAPALIMHGWANALSGNYETAFDSLRRALVLQPTSNGMVLTVLGSTYYLASRHYEAAAILEESIEINPNVLTSRIFLTATYQRLGMPEDAAWEAEEVLALNPEFTTSSWPWAQVFKNKDSPEYQHLLFDLSESGL